MDEGQTKTIELSDCQVYDTALMDVPMPETDETPSSRLAELRALLARGEHAALMARSEAVLEQAEPAQGIALLDLRLESLVARGLFDAAAAEARAMVKLARETRLPGLQAQALAAVRLGPDVEPEAMAFGPARGKCHQRRARPGEQGFTPDGKRPALEESIADFRRGVRSFREQFDRRAQGWGMIFSTGPVLWLQLG